MNDFHLRKTLVYVPKSALVGIGNLIFYGLCRVKLNVLVSMCKRLSLQAELTVIFIVFAAVCSAKRPA